MADCNLINAAKLYPIGGSVAVSGTAEAPLTVVDPSQALKGALFRVEAVCTVAATTAGYWELRNTTGGTVLLNLHLGAAAAIGTQRVWEFDVPLLNPNVLSVFTVKPSVATLGTWQFTVNGAMVP